MLNRAGVTLVELVVAIVLGGIVLGTATVSLLHQEQGGTQARAVTEADAQLAASMIVLEGQLSSLDRSGDLVNGEARDTALQFRAPIASSLACTSAGGSVTLMTDTADAALAGLAAPPKQGDSLWWRGDSTWRGAEIASVTASSARCTPPQSAFLAAFRLGLSVGDTIAPATPVHVTRQTRWSVYRASDGTWQLGFRESTGSPARFAAPQPVVGPLLARSGARRSGFRYFDDTGAELTPSSSGVAAGDVARIRITTHALVPVRTPAQDSLRTDSLDVALLRARRP